jgi:predicted ester cyclase
MSPEEKKALANRFHMDLFVKGDLAVADELVTPDFVLHYPGLPPELLHGAQGVKKYATTIRTAFAGLSITHDDTIAAGDKVVIRWTARLLHQGELMGLAPTGKQATVSGIDIFRLSRGKLAELWQNWDQLGMFQQLGVLSTPGQPSSFPLSASSYGQRVPPWPPAANCLCVREVQGAARAALPHLKQAGTLKVTESHKVDPRQ